MQSENSKTPRRVVHPELGEGKLLRTHMSGYVWEVEFANGKAFRLPAREFEADSVAIVQESAPVIPHKPARPVLPPNLEQFDARQTVETLRFGVVPVHDVETLTIGLETERTALNRAIARSREQGGDVLAVVGDYGFGKSHFVELAATRALRENFIVMTASLDLLETPPGKPNEIYKAFTHALRYPDNADDHSLRHLFRRALNDPATLREFSALSAQRENCPLTAALLALHDCPSQLGYDELINWISGQKFNPQKLRDCLKKPPRLYMTSEVARQYVYLLSGLSVLAKLSGYSGLAVLIDESELYSLVRRTQRERADQFFKALIYAAVNTNKGRIDPNTIPDNPRVAYDLVFAPDPHLFFLFALTASEDQMPIDSWLAPSQIVRLDDRFIDRDLMLFFQMLLQYHRLAYGYATPEDRYKPLLLNAPAMIARALNDHRFNLRQTIKTAVETCDVLYLHPEYSTDAALDDLKGGTGA